MNHGSPSPFFFTQGDVRMPRVTVSSLWEKTVEDGRDDNQYLLALSFDTVVMINSLSLQAGWDMISTEDEKDGYERIERELSEMASINDLIIVLGQVVSKLDEISRDLDDIGALNSQMSEITRYLPGGHEGINRDYDDTTFVDRGEGIPPVAVAPTGQWGEADEYYCRTAIKVLHAAIAMVRELYAIQELESVSVAFVAGALKAVSALLVTLGLPPISLSLPAIGVIVRGILEAGFIPVGEALDLLENDYQTQEAIQCAIVDSNSSVEAEEAIRDFLSTSHPVLYHVVLAYLPWRGWINQVFLGVNLYGDSIAVGNGDCSQYNCSGSVEPVWFMGTQADGCASMYWSLSNLFVIPATGDVCSGASMPTSLIDAVGRPNNPAGSANSPIFSVPQTGTYAFNYIITDVGSGNGNAMYLLEDDTPIDTFFGSVGQNTRQFPATLVAGRQYRIRATLAGYSLACTDNALVLVS